MSKPLAKLTTKIYYLKDYIMASSDVFLCTHAKKAYRYQWNQIKEEEAYLEAGECVSCGQSLVKDED